MRNGVLAAMGEILMKALSKEDLDENLKDTRDQFIEYLEVIYLHLTHILIL